MKLPPSRKSNSEALSQLISVLFFFPVAIFVGGIGWFFIDTEHTTEWTLVWLVLVTVFLTGIIVEFAFLLNLKNYKKETLFSSNLLLALFIGFLISGLSTEEISREAFKELFSSGVSGFSTSSLQAFRNFFVLFFVVFGLSLLGNFLGKIVHRVIKPNNRAT